MKRPLAASVLVAVGCWTAFVLAACGGESNQESQAVLKTNAPDILHSPVHPGRAFSYGQAVLFNDSTQDVRLRSVSLVDATPGMELLGAYSLGPNRTFDGEHLATFSGDSGWPSATIREVKVLRPIAGRRVPPLGAGGGDHGVELYLKMRVPTLGKFTFRRLRVNYVIDGEDLTTEFRHPFTACAVHRLSEGCHGHGD